MLKTTGELNKSLAAKTDQEKLNLKVQEHVLFKEFDKLVSEIDGTNLDNDQKTIMKNSLQKKIDSEIRLNTTKAVEAAANAKFTEENIKTIDGHQSICRSEQGQGNRHEKNRE